ncbi:DUF433 domain-containing protein [candidate division WOR-3 bacterium]|nr:DUF433 domain-containing protein [candidate division WOR-3 bacterium]
MDWRKHIEAKPDIMLGKPVIKGTRIPVEIILRRLGEGADIEEILKAYPGLTRDDVLACINYSAQVIAEEEIVVP